MLQEQNLPQKTSNGKVCFLIPHWRNRSLTMHFPCRPYPYNINSLFFFFLWPISYSLAFQLWNKKLKFCTTYLTEETRIQPGQFSREVLFIHVVEVVEGCSRGVTLLHQLQHRGHARTLKLRQNGSSFKFVVHHFHVGLDAANEIGALRKFHKTMLHISHTPTNCK